MMEIGDQIIITVEAMEIIEIAEIIEAQMAVVVDQMAVVVDNQH